MDPIKHLVVLTAGVAVIACLLQCCLLVESQATNILFTQQNALSDKQVKIYNRSVEEEALRAHGAKELGMVKSSYKVI